MQASDEDRASAPSTIGVPWGTPTWCALNRDGTLLISPLVGTPQNELIVVSIADKRSWVLSHPDAGAILRFAAFDPMQEQVALVVSRANDWRASVWLTSIRGGPVRELDGLVGRDFSHPAFSPDGLSLIYFRDFDIPPLPGRSPGPRTREPVESSIFELRLDTLAERRLIADAVRAPSALAIDNSGRVVFAAGQVLARRAREPDGVVYHVYDSARNSEVLGAAEFDIDAAAPVQAVEIVPTQVAAGSSPRFSDMAANGAWVYHFGEQSEEAHVVSAGLVEDGASRAIISPTGVSVAWPCISSDGNIVAAISFAQVAEQPIDNLYGLRTLRSSEVEIYVWNRRTGAVETIAIPSLASDGRILIE